VIDDLLYLAKKGLDLDGPKHVLGILIRIRKGGIKSANIKFILSKPPILSEVFVPNESSAIHRFLNG